MRLFHTRLIQTLAGGLLLAAAQSAAADEFNFVLTGSSTTTTDCQPRAGAGSFACTNTPQTSVRPWEGTLTIVTNGQGDGTYTSLATGGGLLSFEFASSVPSYAAIGITSPISVIVENGAVTSVVATAGRAYGSSQGGGLDNLSFSGLTAGFNGYFQTTGGYSSSTVATGVLTAVPEPQTYLLMGMGLSLLALIRRRRGGRFKDSAA